MTNHHQPKSGLSKINHLPIRLAILLLISTLLLLGLTSLAMTFFGSGSISQVGQKDDSALKVLVSILPQQTIVQAIGGELVDVHVLVPAGFSPHTYELSVSEMTTVSRADVYFGLGLLGFDRTQLSGIQAANSNLLYVDTSINNQFRYLEAHSHGDDKDHHHDDDHHEEEEHHEDDDHHHDDHHHDDEASLDPHVWLAPTMVMEQAEVIKDTLVSLLPQHEGQIEANFLALIADLEELDQELRAAFAPIEGQTMLVYHPAFGYLADEYGFVQEHIEIEGKEPGPAALQAIINEARADGVRVIFVQSQFSTASARAIAENIGGVVVEVNPLAPDYFDNLRSLAQTISDRL